MFDQVLEGLPSEEQAAVFKAYVEALDEDGAAEEVGTPYLLLVVREPARCRG